VLVTARPSALRQFERALDLFYANIPQIEIEVQVVEFTVSDSLSLGTAPLDNNTPTLGSTNSGTLVQEIVSNFPLSAPFLGSSSINDSGILRLSAIQNGWELNALLQALENNQIADIKSEPKLVVRNGGTATIATTTELPFPQAQISNQTVVSSSIQFKKVGIVLNIRPEIAGTDTVILQVYASVSAVSSFAATEPVPTPIIATREATTSVYLKRGEAAVIGGLVTQNTFETESKIPLLGDIPILGLLFRSSSTQTQRTDLQFFITPRIVTGSRGVRGGFGG
jgi:type II secretory pathway component GspD/PulD (secretin)